MIECCKLIFKILFIFLANGEIFGWGNTEYGQLQLPGDLQQICVPTFVSFCKSLGKIKDIATSGTACMVLNGKFLKIVCLYIKL